MEVFFDKSDRLVIDQAQQRATHAECPMDNPDAQNGFLLFVQKAFQTGKDHRAEHEQKPKMNVERAEDQGRKDEDRRNTYFLPERVMNRTFSTVVSPLR